MFSVAYRGRGIGKNPRSSSGSSSVLNGRSLSSLEMNKTFFSDFDHTSQIVARLNVSATWSPSPFSIPTGE